MTRAEVLEKINYRILQCGGKPVSPKNTLRNSCLTQQKLANMITLLVEKDFPKLIDMEDDDLMSAYEEIATIKVRILIALCRKSLLEDE